jgi:hypothetical protein
LLEPAIENNETMHSFEQKEPASKQILDRPTMMEHAVGTAAPPNMANLEAELTSTSIDDTRSSSDDSTAENEARLDLERLDSSVHPPPVKVRRSDRRGLLGRVTIIAEVENPYHYSRKNKWIITGTIALAGMVSPMGSASLLPALKELETSLHTTPTVTNLSVALYMLSLSISPLWWSSFSEKFGRRSIYLVSFVFVILWYILSAVSKNITMLIIMRIFAGGASASVQSVGAGTIADIWEVKERGMAMSTFYLGPLCGPLLGIVILHCTSS